MSITTTRAAATEGVITPHLPPIGGVTPHPAPPVVLVVDHDPTLLRSLLWSLRSERFRFVGAADADEAFSLLDRNPIDVVIFDAALPGTGGATLLVELGRRHPHTGRIVLTGDANPVEPTGAVNPDPIVRSHVKSCPGPELIASINAVLAERTIPAADQGDDTGHRTNDLRFDHLHTENLHIENLRFDDALARSWIALQPIVRAGTHTVFGHEVLIRGDRPDLMTALQLIDAATELSRLVDLDRVVRRHVLAIIDRLPMHSRVFINLTLDSLHDEDLFRAGAPLHPHASRVVFDIAAHAPIATIPDAVDRIQDLKDLGYRIAFDDLGAGDAGLASMATLKPEIVKFDPALVRHIESSACHRLLLESIIASCRTSGILTLAEAVETAAEAECLCTLGCDLLQGYRFGRPLRWPEHVRDLV